MSERSLPRSSARSLFMNRPGHRLHGHPSRMFQVGPAKNDMVLQFCTAPGTSTYNPAEEPRNLLPRHLPSGCALAGVDHISWPGTVRGQASKATRIPCRVFYNVLRENTNPVDLQKGNSSSNRELGGGFPESCRSPSGGIPRRAQMHQLLHYSSGEGRRVAVRRRHQSVIRWANPRPAHQANRVALEAMGARHATRAATSGTKARQSLRYAAKQLARPLKGGPWDTWGEITFNYNHQHGHARLRAPPRRCRPLERYKPTMRLTQGRIFIPARPDGCPDLESDRVLAWAMALGRGRSSTTDEPRTRAQTPTGKCFGPAHVSNIPGCCRQSWASLQSCRKTFPQSLTSRFKRGLISSLGRESLRLSFIVGRPGKEPRISHWRAPRAGAAARCSTQPAAYAVDRPEGERY